MLFQHVDGNDGRIAERDTNADDVIVAIDLNLVSASIECELMWTIDQQDLTCNDRNDNDQKSDY